MVKLASTVLLALLSVSQAQHLRSTDSPARGLALAAAPAVAALPPAPGVITATNKPKDGAMAVKPKSPKQEEEEEEEEVEEEQEEETEEEEDSVVGVNDPTTDLPQYNPECDPVRTPY